MIIRRSKIAHALEKRGQEVQERADREWQKKLNFELESQKRRHEIALAEREAEIARLNVRRDRLVSAAIEVERKRIQANETIVTAKTIFNELFEEVVDKFDALRHIHGVCDRAKRALGKLEEV